LDGKWPPPFLGRSWEGGFELSSSPKTTADKSWPLSLPPLSDCLANSGALGSNEEVRNAFGGLKLLQTLPLDFLRPLNYSSLAKSAQQLLQEKKKNIIDGFLQQQRSFLATIRAIPSGENRAKTLFYFSKAMDELLLLLLLQLCLLLQLLLLLWL